MKSKKIIAVISAFAIFGAGTFTGSTLTSFTADAENSVIFDVNGDGSVNVNDVTYLKNYIFGNAEETDISYSYTWQGFGGLTGLDDLTMVINTYDELCAFDELCGLAPYYQREYTEEYFEENSLLVICHETGNANEYELCGVVADGTTLKANVDIGIHEDIYLNQPVTDIIMVEYSKDDFSGNECDITRYEYVIAETTETEVTYVTDKPVIYLYPEEETEVNVKLDFNGELAFTYPEYPEKTGWNVTAMPDGTIYDESGREYSYLFWDGYNDYDYDLSEGFVVKGEDTVEFLQEKLEYMGLTPKEYNEFIVYWTPRMQNNKYNLISFQSDVYTDNAVLEVTPKPDSMLRVFMAFKPLDEYVEIPEQKLETFERKGFAVVEWGGSEVPTTN